MAKMKFSYTTLSKRLFRLNFHTNYYCGSTGTNGPTYRIYVNKFPNCMTITQDRQHWNDLIPKSLLYKKLEFAELGWINNEI